jgi:hypothetical protein
MVPVVNDVMPDNSPGEAGKFRGIPGSSSPSFRANTVSSCSATMVIMKCYSAIFCNGGYGIVPAGEFIAWCCTNELSPCVIHAVSACDVLLDSLGTSKYFIL